MTFSDIFKSSFLENVTAVSLPDMLHGLGAGVRRGPVHLSRV